MVRTSVGSPSRTATARVSSNTADPVTVHGNGEAAGVAHGTELDLGVETHGSRHRIGHWRVRRDLDGQPGRTGQLRLPLDLVGFQKSA